MRFVSILIALFVGSFALLSLAPEPAQGCDPFVYGGRVVYSRPYFGPPMYNQPSYGQPSYGQPSYGRQAPMALTIGLYDDYFQPNTSNVQPGTIVRFVNYGRHTHTVTARDGSWDSGDLPPGASYSGRFVYPGTYYIYCRHHTKEKMQGTITVGPGGPSGGGGYSGGGYAGSSGY